VEKGGLNRKKVCHRGPVKNKRLQTYVAFRNLSEGGSSRTGKKGNIGMRTVRRQGTPVNVKSSAIAWDKREAPLGTTLYHDCRGRGEVRGDIRGSLH